MFPRYRTLGFVFRQKDLGEADKIFSVFTKDFGRIEVLGKGIRKISSKLRGGIEIFSISEIEFVEGRYQKRLVGAQIKKRFKKIKKDLKKLSIAFKIAEALDLLIRGPEREKKIFLLLEKTFSKLNFSKRERLIYLIFFWKLISLLGYSLQINFCSLCQKKINQRVFIDFSLGGVICERCQKVARMGREVDKSVLKFLKLLREKDFDFFERLKIKESILTEALSLSSKYLAFLAEKNEIS